MIRRSNDFSIFSNEDFEKIANKLQDHENKKLYKVCLSEKELQIAKQELTVKGYNYQVQNSGENILIFSVTPEKVDLREAEHSGQFKKLAWGRYSFQKVSQIGDFNSYSFDDGSIWKTIVDNDGKEYLVKEVDDNDEEIVIRNKVAGLVKESEVNMTNFVNLQNHVNVVQILYNDSSILSSDMIKEFLNSTYATNMFNFLEKKLETILIEKLQQYNVHEEKIIDKFIEFIESKINNSLITNKQNFDLEIDNFIQDQVVSKNYSDIQDEF